MSNFGGRAGHRRFASALILLTLLAGVTTAGYGLYAWRVAKADEYARLDNLVQFAAKSSNFFFDQFVTTLSIIGEDILDHDGLNNPERGHRLLAQYQRSARGVATVNLFLPDGRWVLSSAVPPGTALPSASTIPNWQAGIRAAADGAGLSVGRPFKGLVTPGLVIPLRYAVRDASGRVVFLLSALIPLRNQQEIWSNVELPDDGSVGLVRSDGYLQSRFPIAGSEEHVYEQRWDGPVFRAAFASGARGSGHIEASSPEDGQHRFIAYHNLQGYPLTAFIAAPSAQVWSLWVGRVQVPFALFAILALGSISIYRHMSLQYESWGQALHLQRERLELLNRISAGVTAGTPFDRLVQQVLEQLAQSFPNTRVSFGTVSPAGRLQFAGSRGCAGLPGVIGLEVDLNVAPQWLQILRAGRPVVANDLAGDARAAPLTALLGSIRARACLHVPLQYPGELLGLLCVDATTPRAWSDDETAMVSEVASYMALALTEARAGEQRSRALADLQESRERIRYLAHNDELTGLTNRTSFQEQLGHALRQSQRHARKLAVLFIDLDRFKNINDTLGHDAGDQVLREVAERLGRCVRESDTMARWGGDEFVVMLEEFGAPNDVAVAARRILEALARPYVGSGQEFVVTASMGISAFPEDGQDAQALLKAADIAMYRAKESGKNNFQYYSPQMNVHTFERLSLESNLRRALERGEFLLHYQPQFDVGSGALVGAEALIRWRHPDLGLVPPLQFIPLAEETGLIVLIGSWVLRTACAQGQAWQGQGLPPVRVAVNISSRQFTHEGLLAEVMSVLEDTGLDPGLLELEITESMLMHDLEQTVRMLNELKALGIHLAIDDFGTGHSSLAYLKRFPVETLKIDRSFVQDLPGDADGVAITLAIVSLAHNLRLKVTAEGVETEEQLAFLRHHGCDEIQGYLTGRPVAAEDFARLLATSREKPSPAQRPQRLTAG